MIKSATEEILIVFPSTNVLFLFKKEDILKSIREVATQHEVKVRILVEKKPAENMYDEMLNEEKFIQIRYPEKSLQTKITTFVIDSEFSIAIEVKNDSKKSLYEAIGLATYSNSDSTVFSYISIFETHWTEAELTTRALNGS